jgi:hypothetical protein
MENKEKTQEELNKEVTTKIHELRAHAKSLTDLCDNLIKIANGGVPALTAVKEAKEVAEGMKEAKESLDLVRRVFKARATALLKDC